MVYVRLIPPGAADTVHYRMLIPENAGNKITPRARLCYRKFAWYGTQEAFAGGAGIDQRIIFEREMNDAAVPRRHWFESHSQMFTFGLFALGERHAMKLSPA